MRIKFETWLGHSIRFVEVTPGEWWGVAADIAEALNYSQTTNMLRKVRPEQKALHLMKTVGGEQEVSVISEKGIYAVIMRSRRKEAEAFQDWVFDVIKQLRQSTGLEGFQVFRMLDKEHQREAMGRLCKTLKEPAQVDFIKANMIANKAVSTKFGYPKMVKKGNMPPDMLIQRQPILEETVELMGMRDRYGLSFSVSDAIYERHSH